MGRIVLRAVLLIAALRAVGAVLSRWRTDADALSDEFSVVAVLGGAEHASSAASLREADVLACCGGVQLDLREATLDPGGADVRLRAYLGGIQLVVPDSWRVVVEAEAKAGGVDTSVAADGDLDQDAPELRVHALAALGGVQVTTDGGNAGANAAASDVVPKTA